MCWQIAVAALCLLLCYHSCPAGKRGSPSYQRKTKIHHWWSQFHQTKKTANGKRVVGWKKIWAHWQKTESQVPRAWKPSTNVHCNLSMSSQTVQPLMTFFAPYHPIPGFQKSSHWGSASSSALSLCLPNYRVPVERDLSSLYRCPYLVPGDLHDLVIISHPDHCKCMPPPTILFTWLIDSAFRRDSPTHAVTRIFSRMFSLVPLLPPSCFALSHLACGLPCDIASDLVWDLLGPGARWLGGPGTQEWEGGTSCLSLGV